MRPAMPAKEWEPASVSATTKVSETAMALASVMAREHLRQSIRARSSNIVHRWQ
jgi:hypothetical protein